MRSGPILYCIHCNQQVWEGIYNSTFYPNLLAMLSAFIALAVIVIVLSAVGSHRFWLNQDQNALSPIPIATTALILGIGIGGFLDGIILHQMLQWHEMLSNVVPNTDYVGKSINMFWDAVFHAFCIVVVMIGIVRLWQISRRKDVSKSGYLLAGGMLSGWGIFNIVEGVIDHHILKLHNVMEFSADHDPANYIFLGISVVMVAAGYWIGARRG